MKIATLSLIVAFLIAESSGKVQGKSRTDQSANQSFGVSAAPHSSSDASEGLDSKQDVSKMTTEHLASIANDTQYSPQYRRKCIFALVRRYRHIKLKLSELAVHLNFSKWLRRQDVSEVVVITGSVLVTPNLEDTVIMVSVFPKSEKNPSAIFFRLSGKFSEEKFYRMLTSSNLDKQDMDPLIEQIGFLEAGVAEQNYEELDRWLKQSRLPAVPHKRP